jgi:hypothetical protein
VTDADPGEIHAPPVHVLLDVACCMRPCWDRDELERAIIAATNATWHPLDVTAEVWRLIHDPDGEPADLRNAARRPVLRPATGAEVAARGKAAVLAAIEEARHSGEMPVLREGP